MKAASGQDQARLPAGRYVYLGADPSSSTPKALSISADGAVIWEGDPPTGNAASANKQDITFEGNSLVNDTSGAKTDSLAGVSGRRTKSGQQMLTPKVDPAGTRTIAPGAKGMEH